MTLKIMLFRLTKNVSRPESKLFGDARRSCIHTTGSSLNCYRVYLKLDNVDVFWICIDVYSILKVLLLQIKVIIKEKGITFTHINLGIAMKMVKIVHPGRIYPSNSTGMLANHWNIWKTIQTKVGTIYLWLGRFGFYFISNYLSKSNKKII